MHLTPDMIWTAVILITAALGVLFLRLTECDDQAEAQRQYEARHDHTVPRQRNPDWDAITAIIEEDAERLIRSTGELRALYQRPYPGVSDTAELRALAEDGDLGGIDAILGRWVAENLTEGEAA